MEGTPRARPHAVRARRCRAWDAKHARCCLRCTATAARSVCACARRRPGRTHARAHAQWRAPPRPSVTGGWDGAFRHGARMAHGYAPAGAAWEGVKRRARPAGCQAPRAKGHAFARAVAPDWDRTLCPAGRMHACAVSSAPEQQLACCAAPRGPGRLPRGFAVETIPLCRARASDAPPPPSADRQTRCGSTYAGGEKLTRGWAGCAGLDAQHGVVHAPGRCRGAGQRQRHDLRSGVAERPGHMVRPRCTRISF
jgi:hypothetical protein